MPALRRLTTLEDLEEKYNKMLNAYKLFESEDDTQRRDSLRLHYKTQLDIYRDTCVVIVERLMSTNPTILEELKLPWN